MGLKPKHLNNGNCDKCKEILNQYKPGVYKELYDFFVELQKKVPSAHVSFAGRGKIEQEEFFKKGTSKAKYGESPHNYNLAIDLFEITPTGARWDRKWYSEVIYPEIQKNSNLVWGGTFKSLVDLPHIEIKTWKDMVKLGQAKLVE